VIDEDSDTFSGCNNDATLFSRQKERNMVQTPKIWKSLKVESKMIV